MSDQITTNPSEKKPFVQDSTYKKRFQDKDQRRANLRARKDSTKRRGGKNFKRKEENPEMDSKVIEVRRVTRVVKGGKRMRFSALVVVGDKKGKIGIGLKKGLDYQVK